jgi:hypothetical protein
MDVFRTLTTGCSAVAIVALTSCGGGNSTLPSSAGMPSAVFDARTPQTGQTPQPWPSAGASFVYGGTIKQTTVGSTTTQQTSHVTARVQTIAATQTGDPVIDYRGVETVSGSSKATTKFDAYVGETPSRIRKGTNVLLLKVAASESSASSGIDTTTVILPGNGVIDQLPEIPQARWSNTASRTVAIDDSYAGSTSEETYRADGSYDQNSVPVEGRTAAAQSYADGNAVYQFPYEGGSSNATVTFAPPVRGTILVAFTNPPFTFPETVKMWYPSFPLVLASDTYRDLGPSSIPASCGVPKAFGTKAVELLSSTTRLDDIYGEYETAQRTMYVAAPYGLICLNVKDELVTYYDYTLVTLSSKPLTTVASNLTIGLQEASVPKGTAAEALGAAIPLDAHLSLAYAVRRLKAEYAIFNALTHLGKQR